jgi:hypothetical protein
MPHKPKAAKKPYRAPSFRVFDARAAQAELKVKSDPKDANVEKMFSSIDRELNRQKTKSRSESRPKP